MIRECKIDRSLNRLQEHFGKHVVIRPPASAADLRELESLLGPLPRELTIFLATCNGLRVEVGGLAREHHIWHVHEMISGLLNSGEPAAPQGLLPVRGDNTAERDWLVIGHTPLEGAVVRWDPWCDKAELIATNFSQYITCWTSYLMESFDSSGKRRAGNGIPFDSIFSARYDDELNLMRSRPDVIAKLHSLDHPAECAEGVE
jgi:hypothetical protein